MVYQFARYVLECHQCQKEQPVEAMVPLGAGVKGGADLWYPVVPEGWVVSLKDGIYAVACCLDCEPAAGIVHSPGCCIDLLKRNEALQASLT